MTRPAESRRRHAPWLLALLIAVSPAAGQRLQVKTFSRDDGLPSVEIVDLDQDPSGRLWVLTAGGLVLYDGREWTAAPSGGLPASELGALEIDAEGRPWVVTRLTGPRVYRLEGTTWHPLPDPGSRLRPEHGVISFVVQAGEAPRVAVGTAANGLWLWSGERWSHLGTPSDLPSDLVAALATYEDTVAAATGEGLCFLDEGGPDCSIRRREPRLADSLLALSPVAARLWILAPTWLGYLEDGRLTVVADHLPLPVPPGTPRGALLVDAAGGIYFGHYQVALYRHPEGRHITTVDASDGLVTNGMTALLADRELNIWVGSARGLTQIVSRRFASYGKGQGLLEDEVTALAEPVPGQFVYGHNEGLTLFDGREATTLSFGEPSAPDEFRVMDMAVDGAGTVWIAANGKGLLRLDGGRLRWAPLPVELASSVALDSRGRLWVTDKARLFVGDGTTFSAVDHGHPDTGYLRWLEIGSGGQVYVSTNQGLLWRDATGWRKSFGPTNEANVLYGLLAEPSGALWVGTRAGLYQLRGDELVKVRRGELEIDDPVYFIVKDDRRSTWFGTDDGVRVWDGRRLRHLTVRHGLAGRETNRGAGLVDYRGRVWIGTDHGVSVYEEAYDLAPAAAPTVELVALEAGGERRSLDAPVELGPRQSALTFHLRAIALSRQEPILVRYLLEGHDAGWQGPVPLPAEGIRYTGVGPGSLRFRATAGWAGGLWSAEAASPAIVIARPLWQRPSVVALGVAGLGLLALGLYGLRTRTVRRRNVELEAMNTRLNRLVRERQRLIAELESRNAELERFTYTVSHDLKSPLVTIRGFLGHLKRDAAAGDAANLHRDVEHIDGAANKMARLLEELLELSRIGRVVHPPEDVDLADLAREAVHMVGGLICQRGVEVAIAADLGNVRGDRLRLLEVMQNLVENAVKYMGRQPAPRIEIGARRGDGERVFFVRDNGSGVEPLYHEKIFGLFERLGPETDGTGVGLALVKRIVEVHGGRIWVESQGAGRGATFCFTLPAALMSTLGPDS